MASFIRIFINRLRPLGRRDTRTELERRRDENFIKMEGLPSNTRRDY